MINSKRDILFRKSENLLQEVKKQIADEIIIKKSSTLSRDIQRCQNEIQKYLHNIEMFKSEIDMFKGLDDIYYKTQMNHIHIQQHNLDSAKHKLEILQTSSYCDGVYYRNQKYNSILEISFYEENDVDSDIDVDSNS